MKLFKCLLIFGSCMSTSSGILHSGADKLLLQSSVAVDNGSDDSGITNKLDQIIKQNRRNERLLIKTIEVKTGVKYSKKKSNKDSYRIQQAVELGYPVSFSSIWDGEHANPRMNDNSNSRKAWCSKVNNQQQWIQVNLVKPKTIQAIQIGNRADYQRQYVKTYKVSYTENGIDWKYYKNGQILQGLNGDWSTKKTQLTPFKAKIVRVHPQTWKNHISLRLEVYFSEL